MLTQAEVLTLHRSLSSERVLSVYIDGSAADPAEQRSWRTQLDHLRGLDQAVISVRGSGGLCRAGSRCQQRAEPEERAVVEFAVTRIDPRAFTAQSAP